MEMHLEIRCKAGPQQETLATIFTRIAEGVGGAVIEEEFEVFGAPVAKALANVLDDFGDYFFNVAGFKIKQDRFLINYVTGFEGGEFLPRLMEFLSLCGCTELKGKAHGDGYTISCREVGRKFVCNETEG
jgi:hypothetical protein